MSDTRTTYVLDAFAVMCYFRAEPGCTRVEEILEAAKTDRCTVNMCTVNWAEVVYTVLRGRGSSDALAAVGTLDAARVHLVPAGRELSAIAAELKAPGGLSLANCYAAALAQTLDATLVTGDPEFKRVADVVDIEWLPTATA